MAIRLKNGMYKCLFCEFTDKHSAQVEKHQDTHNYILVPFTNEELLFLVRFLFTKDETFIDPVVSKRLKTYLNNFNKHKLSEDNNQ